MAAIATLESDLNQHDLVYGIVLPNLQPAYQSTTLKKEEFTVDQAKALDFTATPTYMNHDDGKSQVGVTVAYRVREPTPDSQEKPRAEAILKLNREPDVPLDDEVSRITAMQRNLLMKGAHSGLSAGHEYWTDYVGNCGAYLASQQGGHVQNFDPYGDPGRVVHKKIKEISLCDRGKRPGSDIIEYLPCKRSLQRATAEAIRDFTRLYNYTPPPPTLRREDPGWHRYLDTLYRETSERRHQVLVSQGYSELLRASGSHAASGDRQTKKYLKDVPWLFLPHLESQGIGRFNPFAALGMEVERDRRLVVRQNGVFDLKHSFFARTLRNLLEMAEQAQPPPPAQNNAPQQAPPPAQANPLASPPAKEAPAPAKEEAKRSVSDVVPNNDLGSDAKLDPYELVQRQNALLVAEKQRNADLATRLGKLEQEQALKRKREEEEEKKKGEEEVNAKRAKIIALARTKFEEIAKNGAGGIDPEHTKLVQEQLMEQVKEATTLKDLDAVGSRYGPMIALAHAASSSAKKQREENQQRELRAAHALLSQMAQESVPTSVAVSGGSEFSPPSVVGQSNESGAGYQLPDSGQVRASRFNIFGDAPGDAIAAGRAPMPARGRTQVSEALPDNRAPASSTQTGAPTPAVATGPKGVDLNAPDWASQVFDEHFAMTGKLADENVLRYGGFKQVTKVVASADGGTRQEVSVAPRRSVPLQGPLHMGILDPAGFKSMVDEINKIKGPNGKRPDKALAEMWRWGTIGDDGKPKYLEPYRGPIAEVDKLLPQWGN